VNIFVLDSNPYIAATMMCDKHVNKMIVESCQMLSTIHHLFGSNPTEITLYKKCFVNHPCTIWARKTSENYHWLAVHALSLCHEYHKRYGKVHKCKVMCEWFVENFPKLITLGCLTPFAQAMPDKYKGDDAVLAYRNYYVGEKARFAKWKNGIIPEWFIQGVNNVRVPILQ